MKPPRTIQVGANTFTVDFDEAPIDDGEVAVIVYSKQRICLRPGQVGNYERDSLLHEVLHACIMHSGLKFTTGWDKDQEEGVVASLTPILLDTIRRNPRLIDYLTER